MRAIRCGLGWLAVILIAATISVAAPRRRHDWLDWDAVTKAYDAKPGESLARFVFTVTNESGSPVQITSIQPSCGCTTVESPAVPWTLAPGSSGSIHVTIDLAGKHGELTKTVQIFSSLGTTELQLQVRIGAPAGAERRLNQQIAFADRQSVFSDAHCAACHADHVSGQAGAALYQSACSICHQSPHRASMVPDLATAHEHRDADFWRKWISDGREGTLMPAFSRLHGGPLDESQISALAAFALKYFPGDPPAKSTISVPPN